MILKKKSHPSDLEQYDEWYKSAQSALAATSMDITRMAGQIARSACVALVPFLDLLVASGSRKLALRATLHQENVSMKKITKNINININISYK